MEVPEKGQTQIPMKITLLKSLKRLKGKSLKKLSQEFSKRESRILGALAKLDHFLQDGGSYLGQDA